ncbi:MAG: sigma-70 family RNA polymerase sigma factor [Verrucomicrobia bacterium]|nr:sigma-70 family RNA polymerase sigma factor [Verrucomicrobiota bacterium]
MCPPPTDQARWFAQEIQPHEAALRAYLRSRFPDVRDVDDLVQESFSRVLQSYGTVQIESTKAYLFATARNLALSALRRPKIFSPTPVTDFSVQSVVEESINVAEAVSVRQEVTVLLDAIDALPAACREIFILRKLQNVPQKEIAARLGLSEQTVQVQIVRAIRKCAVYLRKHGVKGIH